MKQSIRYKDGFHLSTFLCLYKHIQATKTLHQIEMLRDRRGWNTLPSHNSCRSFWWDLLSLNDVLTLLHMHIINPYFSMLGPLARGNWMLFLKSWHPDISLLTPVTAFSFAHSAQTGNRKRLLCTTSGSQISLLDWIWEYLSFLWANLGSVWPFTLWMKYLRDLVSQQFMLETLDAQFSGKFQ